jgi:glycosyltransferase involved in cell wall biosynthesis/peptidoglycan/xylan/chitin deacetylase (PgdA/CDA1 family)
MLTQRLYYRFKPYLPWSLRMGMRRVVARRQRRAHQNIWPINEAAGRMPDGWPGWPDGKKFAMVFTHDVEGIAGLEKCRQLMEQERKHGFRSSFNFIPEGEYRVSKRLREELAKNGFEVGVHDLRHDGKLYWKRSEFPENARSINQYLQEWNASGFRSGFMLHNRECLNGLRIAYDASTFDTDPFEPQPEGVNTIFPFWVLRPDGSGYVELPYTLPQDSTLFIVLKENSPDIWKKKLAWIAEHGGMALINVHPDYVGFNENKLDVSEYPAAFYEEFLRHVAGNYKDAYWNALPREVARWYEEKCLPAKSRAAKSNGAVQSQSLKGKRAAVVLYSYYAFDPRPRREAEALSQAGMEIDVICLRQSGESWHEKINGVNVFRIPLKRRRSGKITYVFQYFGFLFSSFFLLLAWNFKKRYQLVHVHNMPDFLVFSGAVPKLFGAKIILDLHDPMPELMMTIFGLQEKSLGVRLLKFLEKISIRFADQVLTVNLACQQIFTSRSCAPKKIQVLMNAPDEQIFKFRNGEHEAARNGKNNFVIMFHGSIVARNGLDLAVEALRLARKNIPGAELRIYGAATSFLDSVMESVRKNNLDGAVRHFGLKSREEVVKAILDCDVGVIPNRLSAFTEINTPTRIFEYLALGKPVITPQARGITDYFGSQDLVFFELGNAGDLAKKLEYVYSHPAEVTETVKRGQAIYQAHSWSRERENFMNRVGELLGLRV